VIAMTGETGEWKPVDEEEGFDEIGVPLAELAKRQDAAAEPIIEDAGPATADPEVVTAADPKIVTDPVVADPVKSAPEEDAYAALEAQFDQLKTERNRLEMERNRAAIERDAERKRVSELEQTQSNAQIAELQNHKLLIEHAYAASNAELEEAKRAYRDARNAGDVDAELTATEALSDAKDKLRQLAAGHQEIVRRLENPPKVTQQQTPAAPAVDDVDNLITDNFPHPRDQAWLRAHKADIFGSDQRKELAVTVDRAARLKGIEPQSDAYYAYLDREMGYEEAEKPAPAVRQPKPVSAPAPVAAPVVAADADPEPATDPDQPVAAPAKRKPPLPGAPVSRSNGGAAGGAERASPALKQLAADLGMTVSEYMANDKAIREGKTHFRYV
jgi:hypothetical protein